MDKKELIEKQIEYEKQGRFNEHITPSFFKETLVVDGNYQYIRKGFKKFISFITTGLFRFVGLFIAPYCSLKVVGRENLKKAKKAIITSNHINDIDCVLVKHAVKSKPLKIIIADFNNGKGFLGDLIRSCGALPLSDNYKAMMNLSNAISYYLNKNNFILVYPENSEWWCYKKPRPLQRGAGYYAVKNDVPIIPMFFTFTDKKTKKDGVNKQKLTLHIGEPIYPDLALNVSDRIKDINAKVFEYNKKTYEDFYNKPLVYEK